MLKVEASKQDSKSVEETVKPSAGAPLVPPAQANNNGNSTLAGVNNNRGKNGNRGGLGRGAGRGGAGRQAGTGGRGGQNNAGRSQRNNGVTNQTDRKWDDNAHNGPSKISEVWKFFTYIVTFKQALK